MTKNLPWKVSLLFAVFFYKDQWRKDGNVFETDTVSGFQNTPALNQRAKTYSALSFDQINFFSMANLFSLSRTPFVKCYCFREPKNTKLSFLTPVKWLSNRATFTCFRNKPYNKNLISLVFSVRTVNYGSSFFPSFHGPCVSRFGHKSRGKN